MVICFKKSYRQHIKKQRCYFANKDPSNQRYGFSNSHVWMWELDHKEDWLPKNRCFRTVVLEKTLESLDSKEIQPVHPKGNQSWIFIGRTVAETKALILWPPDVKSWFTAKDPNSGKDWGPRGEGGDRMRWLDSITDSTALNLSKLGDGDSEGQCSPWDHKELDMT